MAVRKGLQGEQLEKALAKYKGLQKLKWQKASVQFDWTQTNLHRAIGVDSYTIKGFSR